MTQELSQNISVIDPLTPAFEKVKVILFRTFDLGKWFAIGFCAWLAMLGRGGFNFNFRPPIGYSNRFPSSIEQFESMFRGYLPWVIGIGIIVFIMGLAVMLILLWLSSRGRFMFLHCVAANKSEVKPPWHKFRQQANSLFIFRLVTGLIFFVCLAIFLCIIGLIITLCLRNGPHIIAVIIPSIIFLLLIIVPIVIAFVVLLKFTNDFVVPLMFLRTISCIRAWKEFLTILSARKAVFALYILFQIAIAMTISAIVFAAVFLTCCCGACFLAIPYIGTVLLLPVLVFKRAYSLCFLAQFGSSFDVFVQ